MRLAADEGRLVARYYALQATRPTGFIAPIFALFVLRDVTFPEFGVLSAVLSVASVGGEVPAGYVGDRYGRKGSLALSVVLSVLPLLGFVVAQGSFRTSSSTSSGRSRWRSPPGARTRGCTNCSKSTSRRTRTRGFVAAARR